MRLAALAWTVERTPTVEGFAQRLDQALGALATQGVDLVMIPEYAGVEVGAARAGGCGARAEVMETAALVPALEDAMADVARHHGVWLLGGSLPVQEGGRLVNRATLFAPDGRRAQQRKGRMTRFEAEEWGVAPGGPLAVIETPWGRLGIAICYDAEFPPIVRAMAVAGAWLVLVPACTDTLAGATRVTICARARAIENQCFVAVAPTLGAAPWCESLDTNHGRAGIYGPADRGFPADGIIAEGAEDRPGAVIGDLDPGAIERVREHGAVRNHRDWPVEPVACVVVSPSVPVAP
jgi:predicted amidohydrolase